MMGIYIKNEEMPESCYECAYSVEKDGICSITEGGCDWGHSRPPHCPLEEIDLVRCGECKHLKADGTCDMFADDNIRPSASDFCSYGERRE